MTKGTLLAILIILTIAIGIALLVKSSHIDTYIIEGTVKDKFLAPSNEGTTYIVILEDNTKLEIARNFWYSGSEFNEDILYAQIEVGKTYRFTCWGWQLDFWLIYWYPNIIKVEEIAQQ